MSSAPRGSQKHHDSGGTKSGGVELGKSGASAKGTSASASPSAPTPWNANTIVGGESNSAISNNENNFRVTIPAEGVKPPYVQRGPGNSPTASRQGLRTQNSRRGQSQPTPGQAPQLSSGQTSQLTQEQLSQSTQRQPSQPAQEQNPQYNQEQSQQTPQGGGEQNPPANPTQRTRPRAQTATSGTTAES